MGGGGRRRICKDAGQPVAAVPTSGGRKRRWKSGCLGSRTDACLPVAAVPTSGSRKRVRVKPPAAPAAAVEGGAECQVSVEGPSQC